MVLLRDVPHRESLVLRVGRRWADDEQCQRAESKFDRARGPRPTGRGHTNRRPQTSRPYLFECLAWGCFISYSLFRCVYLPSIHGSSAGHAVAGHRNTFLSLFIALLFPAWFAYCALFKVHMDSLVCMLPSKVDPTEVNKFLGDTLKAKREIVKAAWMWSMDFDA